MASMFRYMVSLRPIIRRRRPSRCCIPCTYVQFQGTGKASEQGGSRLRAPGTSSARVHHLTNPRSMYQPRLAKEWWLPIVYQPLDSMVPGPPKHPLDYPRIDEEELKVTGVQRILEGHIHTPSHLGPHPHVAINWRSDASWWPTKAEEGLQSCFIWCGDPGKIVWESYEATKPEPRRLYLHPGQIQNVMFHWWNKRAFIPLDAFGHHVVMVSNAACLQYTWRGRLQSTTRPP